MPGSTGDKQIGRYVLEREIGRGGMATVYEATDVNGRRVALKVLDSTRARSDRALGRFLREGEAASRLEHPNIINIYDVGRDGELCFIAMELIEGPTLEDLIFELRRGRRDALKAFRPDFAHLAEPVIAQETYQRAVLEALAGVADAVEEAHRAGLVHRDIKPSNILIAPDSRLILTDFGLVQDLGADTLTITGDVLGTPLYMSPEQIAGERGRIGPKSDIYALGATMHETLGLNSPYSATDLAVLARQIAHQEPRDLAELNPHLSRSVHTIVRRAMAKRPADRYSHAAEIATDLRRYLSGEPIHARPPSAGERLRAMVRQNQALAWVIGTLLVVILIAVTVVGWLRSQDLEKRQRDARQSYDDGLAFIGQGAWTAAWRAASEIEGGLPESDLGTRLRAAVEQKMRERFAVHGEEGAAGLRDACTLMQSAALLPGLSIDIAAWRRVLTERFLAAAAQSGAQVDESSLDWAWSILGARAPAEDQQSFARYLAECCGEAVEAFQFERATAIVERGRRWSLQTEFFPPPAHTIWNSPSYVRLGRLAEDLRNGPMVPVVGGLSVDDIRELPWSAFRRLVKISLKRAGPADVRAWLELIREAGLPGFAVELGAAAERFPELRAALMRLWAEQPDYEAQPILVAWGRAVRSEEEQVLIARGLKDPSPSSRRFLALATVGAAPRLLDAVAAILGPVGNDLITKALIFRLASLEPEARAPFLPAVVRLGGRPPWEWIEQVIASGRRRAGDLVRALAEAPTGVPVAWGVEHAGDEDPLIRRVARRSLLSDVTTREVWAETILLDSAEDPSFRVNAGSVLPPVRMREILEARSEEISRDVVLTAFSLTLDGSAYPKGTPGHIRRVASLFALYRENGDELVRAWALASLGGLDVYEFAPILARDLASFSTEVPGNLFQEILGRGLRGQELRVLLEAFAARGDFAYLLASTDINAARCRLLEAMGRSPSWTDRAARREAARALMECAARRDLPIVARRAAVRALSAFPAALDAAELKEAVRYDNEGELAAAAAVTLGEIGRVEEGQELLGRMARPGPVVLVAQGWLTALSGLKEPAMRLFEQALLSSYRLGPGSPDLDALPALRDRPEFAEIRRRLTSG